MALAVDKAALVGTGNDVEEWAFGTVDLGECKVVTRVSSLVECSYSS